MCQGEQQIRQCSEVRDSLTRVLHFGPFHGVEISKVTLMKDSCFGDPHFTESNFELKCHYIKSTIAACCRVFMQWVSGDHNILIWKNFHE